MTHSRSLSFLDSLTRPVLRPPFHEDIPIDLEPVKGKSDISILWRRLRPSLSLLWHGQIELQRPIIEKEQRVLWIYKGMPQVGDSLMDLSSRVLLPAHGVQVDLYTDPHLAALYHADDVFARVFSNEDEIRSEVYDLIILDSLKWRCIEAKLNQLRHLPFVTMRGCFSGPEFNRTLFSFFRMSQLLQSTRTRQGLIGMSVPHLCSAAADKEKIQGLGIPQGAVAFAIGGAAPGRTYHRWHNVIASLLEKSRLQDIVLLGSSNAMEARNEIAEVACRYECNLIDCVGRFTLTEVFEILRRCRLAICADGGLMHVANAAGIPTVSLFDRHVAPSLRLTAANRSIVVQSAGVMDDIKETEITGRIEDALKKYS